MSDLLKFTTKGVVRVEDERGKLIHEVPFKNSLTRAWREQTLDATAGWTNGYFTFGTRLGGMLRVSQDSNTYYKWRMSLLLMKNPLDYTEDQFLAPHQTYTLLNNLNPEVAAYATCTQNGITSTAETDTMMIPLSMPKANALGVSFTKTTGAFEVNALCWCIGFCSRGDWNLNSVDSVTDLYGVSQYYPRHFCSERPVESSDPKFGGLYYNSSRFNGWEVDMATGTWKHWNAATTNNANGLIISDMETGTTEEVRTQTTLRNTYFTQKFIINNTVYGVARHTSLQSSSIQLIVTSIADVRTSGASALTTTIYNIPLPAGLSSAQIFTYVWPVMSVEYNETLEKWELVIYQTLAWVNDHFVVSRTTWRDAATVYSGSTRVTTYFDCPVAVGINGSNALNTTIYTHTTLACPFRQVTTNGKTVQGVWLPYTMINNTQFVGISSGIAPVEYYPNEALIKWGTVSGESAPKVLDVYKTTGNYQYYYYYSQNYPQCAWAGLPQPVNVGGECMFINRASSAAAAGLRRIHQSEIMSYVNLDAPIRKTSSATLSVSYQISVE